MNINSSVNSMIWDAICDNFQKAVNNGPWSPQFNQGDNQLAKSFCNFFVCAVATWIGYERFWPSGNTEPMLANEMYDLMAGSPEWMQETDGHIAQIHANMGALVVASKKADPHGHVCIIRPGQMQDSKNYGHMAPRCVNVGATCFIDKNVAYAFHSEPDYFVLKSTIPMES